MLIDIHTHLDQYGASELPGIVARARAAGVGAIVAAGTTVESSRRCVALAREFPEVLAGVGAHPADLRGELSEAELDELSRLAEDERVVVMSETGLDRSEGAPDFGVQERAFRAQIGLARWHGLAVVFHDRGATEEVLRVLAEEGAGQVGGAAHYFQSDLRTAERLIELGFHISLGKPLLRLPELEEVARRVPMDRIVLETDSYPQPFTRKRDRWTEPRDVALVAARLAEVRGATVREVEQRTTENALRMFRRRRRAAPAVPAPPGLRGGRGETGR
ncbi:MAG: TatD family hydrolase [Gemmatimonadetes bacterium]|nr:TatD family hydrolase [Gemmatimonadota bacterium]